MEILAAKFRYIYLRNFSVFREIIGTKFREISRNKFLFRIHFVFREIKKSTFVSTHPSIASPPPPKTIGEGPDVISTVKVGAVEWVRPLHFLLQSDGFSRQGSSSYLPNSSYRPIQLSSSIGKEKLMLRRLFTHTKKNFALSVCFSPSVFYICNIFLLS
jgi:hypothetical protein